MCIRLQLWLWVVSCNCCNAAIAWLDTVVLNGKRSMLNLKNFPMWPFLPGMSLFESMYQPYWNWDKNRALNQSQ